ncbi:MAG: hypothetical protein Q8O90_11670, partial [Elusimicrobiota bacterium]|nr:hypothetical protein [Elusimicrobiota bacterium]
MSFGAGRSITAGVVAGAYEYETGFSSTINYFENKEPSPGASYGDLLDTIDNILGAYKESPAAPGRPPETDYDLAEKFDIRLSHIQEELEAARWEKNLLLEKMRAKEQEEKRNREKIAELEARLKNEQGRLIEGAKELEQVRHLADLKEKADTVRQIEEIRKEELELTRETTVPAAEAAPSKPAAAEPPKSLHSLKPQPISQPGAPEEKPAPMEEKSGPPKAAKSFKSISRGSEIKLETSLGKDLKEAGEDPGLTSRKFKSLGQTQEPAYVYGSHYDRPLPGPEAAPPGAFRPQEALEPLPQQAGGIVYDFTVVTPKPDTQQFQIETRYEAPPYQPQGGSAQPQAVKPPTYDFGIEQPAPAPAPQQAPIQYRAPQVNQGFQFQPQSQAAARQPAPAPQPVPQPAPAPQAKAPEAQTVSPAAQLSPAAVPAPQDKAPAGASDSPDKTMRVPVPNSKGKADVKAPEKPKKKGGRSAFLVILVVFGSMAAGGLGYFFMGEGVSFSEFSMLSLGGKKKPASMDSQLEAKAKPELQPVAAPDPAAAPDPIPAPEAQPQPAPVEKPANESIKKALDIVKGYKLSGGRGNIATWFANSFLSSASGGANEEWTATPLHGDILVVQYRLLRPRQDPLIYQFEVDAAKSDSVRGINNNAIELLDFSSKGKSVAPAPAKKPAAKPKARKSSRPGEIPILP